MAIKPPPIYTIGHSARTLDAFARLLQVGSVAVVVDIRKTPRSRTNPQFNIDTLPATLSTSHIDYLWIEELGGRRPKSKTVPPEVNGFWINQSFHNYADYALSDEFHLGLTKLVKMSSHQRCAIMCSEAAWWRCHRRFVADYLLYNGRDVFHLMEPARAEVASMSPAARAHSASLVYPAVGRSGYPV